MTTEVISTIRSSGGDYTSLTSWEAGEQGNLVSLDEIHTAECYDDWGSGLSTSLNIDGSTTDSTRYMKITVASGHRHNGTFQSAFYIVADTGNTVCIRLNDPWCHLEWLDIDAATNSKYGIYAPLQPCVLKNCLVKSTGGNYCYLLQYNTTPTSVVQSCLAVGGARGFSITHVTLYNCVVSGCTSGVVADAGESTRYSIYNTVVRNCTTNWLSTGVDLGSSHNATSSASDDAPGSNSVTGVASGDFVDATNNDFHLASGSVLIGAGTDLSATFTTDIDGDTWPSGSAWDIGFDYYVSAAAASSPPRCAFPRSILNH